jgi:hypothetical protein
MSPRRALLGCALAASLLGCAPPSECPLVVEALAPRLARIKETQPAAYTTPSAADLRATSAAYTDLAGAAEHFVIADGPVKALLTRYHEIAVDLAVGYDVLARALEADDPEKLKAAKIALDRGGSNEQQLLKKLQDLCVMR